MYELHSTFVCLLTCTLASISTRTTSAWPSCDDAIRGVKPCCVHNEVTRVHCHHNYVGQHTSSCEFTSALASISTRTTSRCPPEDAAISGVLPTCKAVTNAHQSTLTQCTMLWWHKSCIHHIEDIEVYKGCYSLFPRLGNSSVVMTNTWPLTSQQNLGYPVLAKRCFYV